MFPARAGMSPPVTVLDKITVSVPRASGDEPYFLRGYTLTSKCSPRERG